MDVVRPRDLRDLVRETGSPCVSITLPTHRAGPEIEQDRIRLRNLLGEAEGSLRELGLRRPEAREQLAPADELLDRRGFWRSLSDGLAVYCGREWTRTFRLPLSFEELVVVADRPHVKPLLPYLAADGRFFVLALSQNEIRLLEGSRHAVDLVDLERVPTSLEEALHYEEPEKEQQFHAGGRGGTGARAIFHGHGPGGEDEKDRILRYFRKVDRGLAEVLRDERAPLVLAGVDYLLPIYREASDHPYILEGGVEGNPEALSPEELHRRAWEVVEPVFLRDRRDALERYAELAGTGRTTAGVEPTLRAAEEGRVETLFVATDAHVWGRVRPGGSVEVRGRPEADRESGEEDLLDLAAVRTLATSGTVHPLPSAEVPGEAPLASVLRY